MFSLNFKAAWEKIMERISFWVIFCVQLGGRGYCCFGVSRYSRSLVSLYLNTAFDLRWDWFWCFIEYYLCFVRKYHLIFEWINRFFVILRGSLTQITFYIKLYSSFNIKSGSVYLDLISGHFISGHLSSDRLRFI